MSAPQRAGATADLPPGTVTGAGRYAVGNAGGRYFAVTPLGLRRRDRPDGPGTLTTSREPAGQRDEPAESP
jgi:hypothetical protein